MTAAQLARLGLAAYRVGRLVASDEISRKAREAVNGWAGLPEDGANEAPETWREYVAYLVGCPYCVSVWAAAGALAIDRHPRGRQLVDVLAVAGVASVAVSADD